MTSHREDLVFVSYAPFDRHHDSIHLTSLFRRLEEEVRLLSGSTTCRFFYRDQTSPGVDWAQQSESYLREAGVFIGVLTPQFFKSRWCRAESEAFAAMGLEKGRQDTLIPIYYVGDETRLLQGWVASIFSQRQAFDWRELRFESVNSSLVLSELTKVARAIGGLLATDKAE